MTTAQTNDAQQTTQSLIDRSISHDEIVHTEYDADVRWLLMTASDDHVVTDRVTEFWGEPAADGKMTWRVHMAHAVTCQHPGCTYTGDDLVSCVWLSADGERGEKILKVCPDCRNAGSPRGPGYVGATEA